MPDRRLLEILIETAERGVRVEIMVPGRHVDKRVSRVAASPDYGVLLDAGIRLLSYERSMLHTKIVTVDGLLACVGSANFNMRSTRRDEEIAVLLMDAAVTELLDSQFDEDLQACDTIDARKWRRRSLSRRALEYGAQLLKPHA